MKQVFMLLFFSVISFANSKTDTTYSETRTVPKQTTQSDRQYDESRQSPNKYDGHTGTGSTQEDKCENNDLLIVLGSLLFDGIFIQPVKAFFTRNLSVDNFSEKPIRFGFGASFLDFSYYPGVSLSYAFKVNGDLYYVLNETIALREHLGIHLSPGGGFFSDFERDVSVNGISIGKEKDIGTRYINFSFPLYTEAIIKPFGPDGSFFLTIGGGPRYVYEWFNGKREYSYQSQTDSIRIQKGTVIPSVSLGLGRLMALGDGFGTFEIRYSLGFNSIQRRLSLPGDNSKFVHGLTIIQYELIF